MRINKTLKKNLIAITAVFLVLIAGCSYSVKNEGSIIVVEERVNKGARYEFYNRIDDSKEVQKAKAILDNIKWRNVHASMAYPPDYKFHFEEESKGSKSAWPEYLLWVSPNKYFVGLVLQGKYIQLDEDKSKELFLVITGKDLGES